MMGAVTCDNGVGGIMEICCVGASMCHRCVRNSSGLGVKCLSVIMILHFSFALVGQEECIVSVPEIDLRSSNFALHLTHEYPKEDDAVKVESFILYRPADGKDVARVRYINLANGESSRSYDIPSDVFWDVVHRAVETFEQGAGFVQGDGADVADSIVRRGHKVGIVVSMREIDISRKIYLSNINDLDRDVADLFRAVRGPLDGDP